MSEENAKIPKEEMENPFFSHEERERLRELWPQWFVDMRQSVWRANQTQQCPLLPVQKRWRASP